MHEAGAAQAIVEMLSDLAREKGASRVSSVRVVAGETAAYMEESLAFYLGFFAKGGPVEGARLELEVIKPRMKCKACGLEFERQRFSFSCPACGGDAAVTDLGTEFYIDSAEFEFGPEGDGANPAAASPAPRSRI
jgi:hydrogenase nickel incorporation protein HypA/HybF